MAATNRKNLIKKGKQPTPRLEEESKDLGFGSRVSQQSRERFLNKDGSYNVSRAGLPFFRSLNLYHFLMTMSWGAFFVLLVSFYFGVNIVFAFGYFLCGPDALHGSRALTTTEHLLEDFFFSVQTLATIGYGGLSPSGIAANILVTFQALIGGLGFALSTGLVFARFSRPSAKIIFSEKAIIAPYRKMKAFEFRIVNANSNELVDVNATVSVSRIEQDQGKRVRRFYGLKLERNQVRFFPLHWVIVHPIDKQSPLYGITHEDLEASDAEFLVLLSATDDTSSQTVHVRTSYKYDELVWGARFSDIFKTEGEGMGIDVRKLHDIEPAKLDP
jgi:inward rectifier potassium channel